MGWLWGIIYGIYKFEGQQVFPQKDTQTGTRLNYVAIPNTATIELYLDPDQDTDISGILNCQINVTGNSDDQVIGNSNAFIQGEKSETDGLANGDFEIVSNNWNWVTPDPIQPNNFSYDFLRFNANVTRLRGPLNVGHNPEGSGNLFWRNNFTCLTLNPNIPNFLDSCAMPN